MSVTILDTEERAVDKADKTLALLRAAFQGAGRRAAKEWASVTGYVRWGKWKVGKGDKQGRESVTVLNKVI